MVLVDFFASLSNVHLPEISVLLHACACPIKQNLPPFAPCTRGTGAPSVEVTAQAGQVKNDSSLHCLIPATVCSEGNWVPLQTLIDSEAEQSLLDTNLANQPTCHISENHCKCHPVYF